MLREWPDKRVALGGSGLIRGCAKRVAFGGIGLIRRWPLVGVA